MPDKTRIVAPGTSDRTVCAPDGEILNAPADWERLPPGDAALTRRVLPLPPLATPRSGRTGQSVGSPRPPSLGSDVLA